MIIPLIASTIATTLIFLATWSGFTMEYQYKGRHA